MKRKSFLHTPIDPYLLLLKILIIYVFIQYFLRFDLGLPPRITLIDDLLFYLLIALVLMQRMAFFRMPYYVLLPLILIMSIGIFAGQFNHSPLRITILGLRGFLQYMFLFFLIINLNISKEKIMDLTRFFVDSFLLLQVPFLIFQLARSILLKGLWSPDISVGTFGMGGANTLSYAAMIPLFLVIGQIIEENNFRYGNMLRLFLLLFVFIFPQGRFAIILAPCVFVFIYKGKIISQVNLRKWAIRFGAIIGGLFVVFYIFNKGRFLTSYNLYDHFTKHEFDVHMGSNRYLWLSLLWQYISKSGVLLLFGYGPGEFWSFIATNFNRPLVVETFNYWGQLSQGVDTGCATGLVPVIGEFGFVGFFLFMWIFYKNYRLGMDLFKRSDNPLLRSYCLPVIAGSIMMITGVYIHSIWEQQNIAFFYWFFVGILYKLNMEVRQEQRA